MVVLLNFFKATGGYKPEAQLLPAYLILLFSTVLINFSAH